MNIKLKEPPKKINPKKENEFQGMSNKEIYHYISESEIAYKNYLIKLERSETK